MEKTTTTILQGYTDEEKGAYLGAIASIATADRAATEDELSYLEALAESAELSDEQKTLILDAAATDVSDEDLKRCLDVLKNSELRFNLVSDVIAFAEADKSYSEEEKQNVSQIAKYLGVNHEQLSLLDQFTKKAVKEVPNHAEAIEANETTPHNFLEGLGFGDKLKNAGINTNGLLKGALAILGPIILAKMLKGKNSNPGGLGGMFGGNNNTGGLGGMFGGNNTGSGGGGLSDILGSGGLGGLFGGNGGGLLGGLFGGNSGRGGLSGAGDLLSRIFK